MSHFLLKFLQSFSGDMSQREPSIVAKDISLTLCPDERRDFEELVDWAKSRTETRLLFEKFEVTLNYSTRQSVDETFVDSLRSSLAEYVDDTVIKTLFSP